MYPVLQRKYPGRATLACVLYAYSKGCYHGLQKREVTHGTTQICFPGFNTDMEKAVVHNIRNMYKTKNIVWHAF